MYVCGILLGVILICLRGPLSASACSCSVSHIQQQFCHSNLVALVEVVNETNANTTFPQNRVYTTNIVTLFKGSRGEFGGILTTSAYDSLCGVELELSQSYVVSGKLNDDNELRISLCGLVAKWSELSDFQRKSLKTGYGNSCQCQIIPCYDSACEPVADVCYLNTYDYALGECLESSSLCTAHDGTGRCTWEHSSSYNVCVKQLCASNNPEKCPHTNASNRPSPK